MSDLLMASEIAYPGAGDSLRADSLTAVDTDLLEASRATGDRASLDWGPVVDWLIDQGRWREGHQDRLQELVFEVFGGLEPRMIRQIRDDAGTNAHPT
jgi:hypothetical protein